MNIYLLIQSEQNYGDCYFSPVLATPNHKTAHLKMAELEQLRAKVIQANIELQEHLSKWETNNSRIYPATPKPKPVPKFKGARNKWTQEQRDEVDSIIKQNFQSALAAAKPANTWAKNRYEEQLKFIQSYPKQVQDNLFTMNQYTFFEIEEVKYED